MIMEQQKIDKNKIVQALAKDMGISETQAWLEITKSFVPSDNVLAVLEKNQQQPANGNTSYMPSVRSVSDVVYQKASVEAKKLELDAEIKLQTMRMEAQERDRQAQTRRDALEAQKLELEMKRLDLQREISLAEIKSKELIAERQANDNKEHNRMMELITAGKSDESKPFFKMMFEEKDRSNQNAMELMREMMAEKLKHIEEQLKDARSDRSDIVDQVDSLKKLMDVLGIDRSKLPLLGEHKENELGNFIGSMVKSSDVLGKIFSQQPPQAPSGFGQPAQPQLSYTETEAKIREQIQAESQKDHEEIRNKLLNKEIELQNIEKGLLVESIELKKQAKEFEKQRLEQEAIYEAQKNMVVIKEQPAEIVIEQPVQEEYPEQVKESDIKIENLPKPELEQEVQVQVDAPPPETIVQPEDIKSVPSEIEESLVEIGFKPQKDHKNKRQEHTYKIYREDNPSQEYSASATTPRYATMKAARKFKVERGESIVVIATDESGEVTKLDLLRLQSGLYVPKKQKVSK